MSEQSLLMSNLKTVNAGIQKLLQKKENLEKALGIEPDQESETMPLIPEGAEIEVAGEKVKSLGVFLKYNKFNKDGSLSKQAKYIDINLIKE